MKSTDILVEEHNVILKALAVLGALADRASRGEPVDRAPVERLVTFFREFADRFHHAKEENELFPFMVSCGMPRNAGPIAVMLHEHEQGRALVGKIADAASKLDSSDGRGQFADAAHGFEDLLTHHIMKENEILFPMGARLMNAEADDRLMVAFDQRERAALGEGRAAFLRAEVESLAKEVL
ncbi:MAG: hemerythrin domain-containing protein [Byssovorax sp.]